jgi:hypothetical protein
VLNGRADLEKDKPFLAHLRDTIQLLQDTVLPFGTVMLGIMDQNVYTQVVCTQPPLAAFTRREAVCAHVIQQSSGSVLYLPDMRTDPYFARSPFVTEAGLVSYVGAPLCVALDRADSGHEEVVLGTLCAIDFCDTPPKLSVHQQRVIARFAASITHQIVERARTARLAERHAMDARLSALAALIDVDNVVDAVLACLRETYLDEDVSLQHHTNDTISLLGSVPAPHANFTDDIHEATADIEAHIVAFNHLPASAQAHHRTLRAVAVICPGVPHTYLVVQTAHLTHVFDDIDVAFVRSCALILARVHIREETERAPRAAYFRRFSDELRAPIHIILRSCELLVEDAKSTQLLCTATPGASGLVTERFALLGNALASGRALWSAVDSLVSVGALDHRSPVLSFPSVKQLD